jgi:putative tryptophan/tyrosine transport system substrate-binding protein
MTSSGRTLAVTLIVAVLAGSVVGEAQQPAANVPRIGFLMFRPMTEAAQDAFRQGLRDHAYVEGQNIVIEWRSADGRPDRAKTLADDLVRLKVSVIVAEFTPCVRAAETATHTIPIVMAPAGDPVATGLVASLARPGSNVTGLTDIVGELSGKRLELLRAIVPGLARVGLLINGADPLDPGIVDKTRGAAAGAGVQLSIGHVPRPEELDAALAAMTRDKVGAVIVQANIPVPASQTARLTARSRLPSISNVTAYPEAGGLMSYGPSLTDIERRSAGYVDRILKGTKPADLPVEQPTKFELVINLKTAKALGLTIPPSVRLQADQIIE